MAARLCAAVQFLRALCLRALDQPKLLTDAAIEVGCRRSLLSITFRILFQTQVKFLAQLPLMHSRQLPHNSHLILAVCHSTIREILENAACTKRTQYLRSLVPEMLCEFLSVCGVEVLRVSDCPRQCNPPARKEANYGLRLEVPVAEE